MGNLHTSGEYKHKIINLLERNENFVKLMNPTPSGYSEIDDIDVLNGGQWFIDGEVVTEDGQVFDYDFVDETITDEKTYCFVETDVYYVRENIFTDFNLYVCLFSHKNLVRLTDLTTPTPKDVKEMGYFATDTYANRIDALCECVDNILNGSEHIYGIGTVNPAELEYMSIYTPNYYYYGKMLKYTITNYNSTDECH